MSGRLYHGDPNAQFYTESVDRQVSKVAGLIRESSVDLYIDRNAGICEERWVMHIDKSARFRAERPGGWFSRKIYRFHFKRGSRDIRYEGSWTEERYLSLLAQQKKQPVPLTTEAASHRTWWIYRDNIYWEDFSAREVLEKRRAKLDVLKEARESFLKGTDSSGNIVKKHYYFFCELGRRKIQHNETLTEQQYRFLLNQTTTDPVSLLSENGKTWWMYQDKIYWAKDDLNQEEVRKLFFGGIPKLNGISRGTKYRFSCKVGLREVRQEKPLTRKEYESLLVLQEKLPVLMLTDSESGARWWMFRDEFYRVYDELRAEEARALFLEGSVIPDGISRETRYRFRSRLGNQEIQQENHLTARQYQSLLASQKEKRVHVFSDAEVGKTWTMFRNEFFWEDYRGEQNREFERIEKNVEHENRRDEERPLYPKYRRSRAYWRDDEEHSRHPGSQGYWGGVARTMIPDSVKDRVWERDQGRCVKCGSDEKVEYDYIRPLSEGLNKTEYNVQLLCSTCKGKKDRDDIAP